MIERTVGIDLGIRAPSVAVVLDEPGEVLIPKLRFELRIEELEKVERRALEGLSEGARLHVVMEKTFPTCEYVGRFFSRRGHRVSYARPEQVKKFREALSPKVKTDGRDAWVIARLPFMDPGQLERVHVPSQAAQELKTLASQRSSMVRQLVFLKNQLNRSASVTWPGLRDVFDDLDSGHARAFIRELKPIGRCRL